LICGINKKLKTITIVLSGEWDDTSQKMITTSH